MSVIHAIFHVSHVFQLLKQAACLVQPPVHMYQRTERVLALQVTSMLM